MGHAGQAPTCRLDLWKGSPYPQAAAHGACGPGTHLQVGPVEGVEEAGGDRGDVLAQRGDRGADKRLAYTQEALAPLNHLRQ